MGPFSALNSVIVNAFNFSGRASRPEFWWFFLWDLLLGIAALGIDLWGIFAAIGPYQDYTNISRDPFEYLILYWVILSFIPRLSVTIRRLHDAGFSGAWYFLVFAPFGSLVVLIMTVMPSERNDNNYGPPWSPLGGRTRTGADGKTHNPMQGYAYLEASRAAPTPEMLADRKAQMRAFYEQRVLGQT